VGAGPHQPRRGRRSGRAAGLAGGGARERAALGGRAAVRGVSGLAGGGERAGLRGRCLTAGWSGGRFLPAHEDPLAWPLTAG